MVIRTDQSDVKVVMTIATLTVPEIDEFIALANLIVERNLVASKLDYEDDELVKIELYLSCHFCALKEPRTAAEKVDVISTTVQGKTGMNLDSTFYGQTAMMVDRFGLLKKLGEKRLATVLAITSFA